MNCDQPQESVVGCLLIHDFKRYIHCHGSTVGHLKGTIRRNYPHLHSYDITDEDDNILEHFVKLKNGFECHLKIPWLKPEYKYIRANWFAVDTTYFTFVILENIIYDVLLTSKTTPRDILNSLCLIDIEWINTYRDSAGIIKTKIINNFDMPIEGSTLYATQNYIEKRSNKNEKKLMIPTNAVVTDYQDPVEYNVTYYY